MPLRSIMLPSEARRPDLGAEPKRFGGERKRRRTAHEGSERALCQTGIDTNPCSPIFEPSLSWTGIDIGRAQGAIPAASAGPCRQAGVGRGRARSWRVLTENRGRSPRNRWRDRPRQSSADTLCWSTKRRHPSASKGRATNSSFPSNPPKEADRLAGANARGSPSGHASIDSTRSMSS